MDDAGIVESMRQQDQAGLAAAYSAYANSLYTYCVSQLRDENRAGDVVHDTFIVAYERIDQLRDPSRLRPWLYAIARNECQRVFRERNRTAALDEAAAVSDESVEMDARLRESELRGLVQTAVGGLNPREREVIELAVQHDLAVDDVAATLGQSTKYVHALLSKARQQLEKSLSALIVARTGREWCGTLDGLLAGWDGGMTVLLRKRVSRHIESCQTCSERKRRDVNAMALLATTPVLVAPLALRSRVLSDATDVSLVSSNREIAARAGKFDPDGFPAAAAAARRTGGWMLPVAAALIGAAIVLGGVSYVVGGPLDNLLSPGGESPAPVSGGGPTLTMPSPTPSPAVPSPPATTPPATASADPTPGETPGDPSESPPPTDDPPGDPSERPEPSGEPTGDPEPTSDPTDEPEPPDPTDPGRLEVYCDYAMTQPCSYFELDSRSSKGSVYLKSSTDDVLNVRATSTEASLDIEPPSSAVGPDRTIVSFYNGCGKMTVRFTVAEPSHEVRLTVYSPQPCLRRAAIR